MSEDRQAAFGVFFRATVSGTTNTGHLRHIIPSQQQPSGKFLAIFPRDGQLHPYHASISMCIFIQLSVKIKNVSVKEYIDEYSTTVVIFMDLADSSDKMELVWPEEKSPYLLQITPQEDGAAICKMNLSQKPVVASEEDALIQLLNSLGGF